MKILVALGCVLFLLGACNGSKKHPGTLPQAVPAQEYRDAAEARASNPGSLYNEAEADHLFSDGRAHRVGDLVVVKIVEQTTSKTKADTSAGKNNSNNYGVGAFFGQSRVGFMPVAPSVGLPNVGKAPVDPTHKNLALDTSSVSNFSGTGETKRENYVKTSMATRVTRVLPGGLLQIEGTRETRVNEETEYMVVTGVIRSKDVSADNTVLSTQVADASISYSGKGVLGDKQKPGWFTRLMDNLWPF
jgi:flagellar L-ring protein precursor FlgH